MPVHEGHGPPRVLLGNLEPMVELGMSAVLEDEGIEVLGAEPRPAALVLMASSLQPDAVVLDLRRTGSHELADRIRAASPATTVVFWTRDEDVMEVIGPGTSEPRRVSGPVPEELRSELLRSRVVARSIATE